MALALKGFFSQFSKLSYYSCFTTKGHTLNEAESDVLGLGQQKSVKCKALLRHVGKSRDFKHTAKV